MQIPFFSTALFIILSFGEAFGTTSESIDSAKVAISNVPAAWIGRSGLELIKAWGEPAGRSMYRIGETQIYYFRSHKLPDGRSIVFKEKPKDEGKPSKNDTVHFIMNGENTILRYDWGYRNDWEDLKWGVLWIGSYLLVPVVVFAGLIFGLKALI